MDEQTEELDAQELIKEQCLMIGLSVPIRKTAHITAG